MPVPPSYPVTTRNRAKRRHDRASYDHAAVHTCLDGAMIAHLAYVIDGQPFCTPTLYWRDGETLLWHGSSASRMLRAQAAGLAVCLTVTHLDALVLARSGFNHSANYRSAMCFGTTRALTRSAEKRTALDAMIDRFYPERLAALRPMSAQELKATTVIAMTIEQASAKTRATGVCDDAGDLGQPVWAGLIPVRTTLGAPETAPDLAPGIGFPAALAPYRDGASLDAALLATAGQALPPRP